MELNTISEIEKRRSSGPPRFGRAWPHMLAQGLQEDHQLQVFVFDAAGLSEMSWNDISGMKLPETSLQVGW